VEEARGLTGRKRRATNVVIDAARRHADVEGGLPSALSFGDGGCSRMQNVRVDLGSASVRMVQLKERHDELEKRLAELERHLSLTPDEQLERSRLQKEQL